MWSIFQYQLSKFKDQIGSLLDVNSMVMSVPFQVLLGPLSYFRGRITIEGGV